MQLKVLNKILLFTILLIAHSIACAQSAKISAIDVYGNRKIPSDIILSYINTKKGDSINPISFKTHSVILALKTIPGMTDATVSTLCCDAENRYSLYTGIAESDANSLKYRPPPKQNMRLSDEIINACRNFNEQVKAAALKGEASEEYYNGYSLLTNAASRKEQSNFMAIWKNRGHALFSLIILCRMAGEDESSFIERNFSNKGDELVEYLI